jgi:hypothetical protein
MIRKSGLRFSEKIMLKQKDSADKFGVILAAVWLIDAAANCGHGTNVIAL